MTKGAKPARWVLSGVAMRRTIRPTPADRAIADARGRPARGRRAPPTAARRRERAMRSSVASAIGASFLYMRVFTPRATRTSPSEGRWMAAVLACGPGAALSHRAAAALHGLRPAWRDFRRGQRAAVGQAGRGRDRAPAARSIRADRRCAASRSRPWRARSWTSRTWSATAALRAVLEQAEILRLDAHTVPIPGRRGHGRLLRGAGRAWSVRSCAPARTWRSISWISAGRAGLPATGRQHLH